MAQQTTTTNTAAFNPDVYGTAHFPYQLFYGISNYGLSYTVHSLISSEDDSRKLLAKIKEDFDNRNNSQYMHEIALDATVEKELVLLSHAFNTSNLSIAVSAQELLGNIRQEKAFRQCFNSSSQKSQASYSYSSSAKPSYHDLAFLYYTLMHGQSTLGHHRTAEPGYVAAMREFRKNGIETPQVLLLGFSSIYSLENLAAMLYLVGFKQSEITAIDKMQQPIEEAKKYCGEQLYNSKINYQQVDINNTELIKKITQNHFDLVATHLFFTHFPSQQKAAVWQKAKELLKSGGEFVDEELIAPGKVDRDAFNDYFRTLAKEYYPSKQSDCQNKSEILRKISDLMFDFGSQGPFHPYYSLSEAYAHASQFGLQLNPQFLCTRNIFDTSGGLIDASMYAFRTKK